MSDQDRHTGRLAPEGVERQTKGENKPLQRGGAFSSVSASSYVGRGTIELRGSGDEVIEQPRLPQHVGVVCQLIYDQEIRLVPPRSRW